MRAFGRRTVLSHRELRCWRRGAEPTAPSGGSHREARSPARVCAVDRRGRGQYTPDIRDIPADMRDIPADMSDIPAYMRDIPADMSDIQLTRDIPADMRDIPADIREH